MSNSQGIEVYIRVRPPIRSEIHEQNAVFTSGNSISLKGDRHDITCNYHHIWDEIQTQADVFSKIQPLLDDVLQGYNGCIFAYGQTSSGKTHTMLGPQGGQNLMASEKGWGILPRAATYIFNELESRAVGQGGMFKYHVKASFLQIYNELLIDLLRDPPKVWEQNADPDGDSEYGLKIREIPGDVRWGEQGRCQEVFVSGLSEFRVQTADDVLRLMAIGSGNRETRATQYNQSSSRSHAILQLAFEIESLEADGTNMIHRSKLSLVDLAGSEKLDVHDDNSSVHLRELSSINKSLSSLGNVIAALSNPNRPHIPYRDSKLTRLLQDSLGGNTRTMLIACVAPTVLHSAETASTLAFADRARNVIIKVRANVVVDDKMLLSRAYAEIERLRGLLRRALERNEDAEDGDGDGGGEASAGHGGPADAQKRQIIDELVAEEAGKFKAEAEQLSSKVDRLSKENDLLREQLRAALNQPQGRLGGRVRPGEEFGTVGGAASSSSSSSSAAGAASLSASSYMSSNFTSTATAVNTTDDSARSWFEPSGPPPGGLRPLGAGQVSGGARVHAGARSTHVYLSAPQQMALKKKQKKENEKRKGWKPRLPGHESRFPGEILEATMASMRPVKIRPPDGLVSPLDAPKPPPPRAMPAPKGLAVSKTEPLPRPVSATDDTIADESEDDMLSGREHRVDTPPPEEIDEEPELVAASMSRPPPTHSYAHNLPARGQLKQLVAKDKSLKKSAKEIAHKLQYEEANLENISKMKAELEKQLQTMQSRRTSVVGNKKAPKSAGIRVVPAHEKENNKAATSTSPQSSSSGSGNGKSILSPQQRAAAMAREKAHCDALNDLASPAAKVAVTYTMSDMLPPSTQTNMKAADTFPSPVNVPELKGATKKKKKGKHTSGPKGKTAAAQAAAAAAAQRQREEEDEEDAAAEAAVAAALQAALLPSARVLPSAAKQSMTKAHSGLRPGVSMGGRELYGRRTDGGSKSPSPSKGNKAVQETLSPGKELAHPLSVRTSMDQLATEEGGVMQRFDAAPVDTNLLAASSGPSILDQLEAKKMANASPDRKPLAVGRRMEIFNKAKGVWEKFTVADFEPSKGMYKCDFYGSKTQWLNLRQREVRELK